MIPNLGKIIRSRRQAMHLTIEELAERSDSSVSFISMLELGQLNNIKLQKLAEILTALKLDFKDIFGFPEITDSASLELIQRLADLPESERSELANLILKILDLNK